MRANRRWFVVNAGKAADADPTCITGTERPRKPPLASHTWPDYVTVGLKDIECGQVPVVCSPDRHQMSKAETADANTPESIQLQMNQSVKWAQPHPAFASIKCRADESRRKLKDNLCQCHRRLDVRN